MIEKIFVYRYELTEEVPNGDLIDFQVYNGVNYFIGTDKEFRNHVEQYDSHCVLYSNDVDCVLTIVREGADMINICSEELGGIGIHKLGQFLERIFSGKRHRVPCDSVVEMLLGLD